MGIYKNFRDLEWQSWKDIKVGTVLSDINEGKVIALKEVPNAKLWKEKALSHALQDDAAADSVEDLVLALQVEDLDTRFVKKILKAAASEGYKQRLLLGADPMKVDLILEKEPSGEFIKLDGNSKGYSASPIYSNVPLFTNISAVLQKDIKSWLQVRLPDYMIPGIIVELDEMPLTPNGKIDKKSLPLPGTGDYITNEYVAPRSAFESKVADIWKEVLEIERVGIHDNFFDLGGHSLKAIQLISRLQKRLHVKTDIAKILANPTIFELTRLLALEKPRALVEIPRLAYQPHYELSHGQKKNLGY